MRALLQILLVLVAMAGCSKPHNYTFAPNNDPGGVTLAGSPDSMQVWVRAYGDYATVPRVITWPSGAFDVLVAFRAYQPKVSGLPWETARYTSITRVVINYHGRFVGGIATGQRLLSSTFDAYPQGVLDSLGVVTSTFDVSYSDSDSTWTGEASMTSTRADMLGCPIPIKLYLEGLQPQP
jgi:hypothetical protein